METESNATQLEFHALGRREVVGRFDGGIGQVLRGDGVGGFTAVDPAVSGFVVPGEVKSITWLAGEGEVGDVVLVTRNNDTSLLFQP